MMAQEFFGEEEPFSLVEAISRAKQDWEAAKMLFREVTEPELIDFAIYQMEAAERRYMHLLRRAREEGVSGWSRPVVSSEGTKAGLGKWFSLDWLKRQP